MDATPYYLAEPATEVEFLEIEDVPTIAYKANNQPMNNLSEVFDTAYAAIFNHADEMGVSFAGPVFALYTSLPSDVISLEAGVPVEHPLAEPFTTREGVVIEPSVLPGGKIARMTYFGAYEGLGDAWRTFMQAVAAAGKKLEMPYWEIYVGEPGPDVDPATLRTDLVTRIRS